MFLLVSIAPTIAVVPKFVTVNAANQRAADVGGTFRAVGVFRNAVPTVGNVTALMTEWEF